MTTTTPTPPTPPAPPKARRMQRFWPRRRRKARPAKAAGAPRATATERRARIEALWLKAQAAARSARLLCASGDPDGAANRAYYATFGAARAALATFRYAQASSRHHGTIYGRFDRLFVQERGLDPSLGRPLLHRLSGVRSSADYGGGALGADAAQGAVDDMERFLAAVAPILSTVKR